MIPWGIDTNKALVERIHNSMDFLVGGNRVNDSINNQFSVLIDYLLHNKQSSLNHYYSRQAISEEALDSWARVMERTSHLETEIPNATKLQIADIDANYRRFLRQATTAIALKKFGRTHAAIDAVVGASDLLLTDIHETTSKAIQEGANTLVKRVSSVRVKEISILTIILVLSAILTLQMLKSMLTSLNTLNQGMRSIQSGDLDHRINLQRNDIIDKLAKTFNSMMNSLCQTQASLKKLTLELEERVAKRTNELAAANKDLESFNSMVSHDLRAPLSAIYGYSQLMLLNINESDPEETAETLDKIVQASETMSRIVSALESLSRASHKPLSREPVDLRAMATEILNNFSNTDQQRKVKVIINPAPNALGDRDMLEIALTNLLGNSWKYCSKTPNAQIEFGSQLRAGKAVWYVKDNGAGFDMKHADRLFKTFGRLHSDDDFKGIGIGLATVQRVIQRHGGDVWAEGKVEQGATFYFHLG